MHYQYYQARFRSQSMHFQNPYAHVSVTHVSTPRRFHHQHQTEPIPAFDDMPPLSHRPSLYTPSNPPSRMSSEHDSRLATASALRERILTNIQESLLEIDRELSSLPPPSATLRPRPPLRVPPLDQQPSLLSREISHGSNQTWPNKPKRVYKVVPRLPSTTQDFSRQTSAVPLSEEHLVNHSTPKPSANMFASPAFVGQYHYGPEADEVEIAPKDPEDIEYTSIVGEFSELDFDGIMSTQEFLREPSVLSQHRAMIFVPQFADPRNLGADECTEDLLPTNPSASELQTLRAKTTSPPHDFPTLNAIHVQNHSLLIQTAPIPPPASPTESNLTNSIISKPVKHARQPSNPSSVGVPTRKSPSPPPILVTNTATPRTTHFFSDFGVDGDNEEEDEDMIVIDPSNFTLHPAADTIPESSTGKQSSS